VKQKDLTRCYTDYEYIYLTVLGFAALQQHNAEIVRQNNGQGYGKNPGTQLLERCCGMTMHGNRQGSNMLLQNAPSTLLKAFAVANRKGELKAFFKEAFDRCSDPCLEGRVDLLITYVVNRTVLTDTCQPPVEDMAVQPLQPSATAHDIIGEHLRVFINECTWVWCCEKGLTYSAAKLARTDGSYATEFRRYYNAPAFECALQVRGVVVETDAKLWEVMTESGEWQRYDNAIQAQIRAAKQRGLTKLSVKIGPKGWMYELHLESGKQCNPKTGRERPMRMVQAIARQPGTVSNEDMKAAIAFFIDMQTLPSVA
jgi:hypothetical protein